MSIMISNMIIFVFKKLPSQMHWLIPITPMRVMERDPPQPMRDIVPHLHLPGALILGN